MSDERKDVDRQIYTAIGKIQDELDVMTKDSYERGLSLVRDLNETLQNKKIGGHYTRRLRRETRKTRNQQLAQLEGMAQSLNRNLYTDLGIDNWNSEML